MFLRVIELIGLGDSSTVGQLENYYYFRRRRQRRPLRSVNKITQKFIHTARYLVNQEDKKNTCHSIIK